MNESTNFGLKTTGDNDQWRNTLDYHNENMGVIDSVMAKNQDALGIIVDGNKAAVSATTGQYIILRNSTITGKTDGLYTAAKSIPANTAIDGTYLTAVSGGGLNALNGKITTTSTTATLASGWSVASGQNIIYKSGNIASMLLWVSGGTITQNTWNTIATIPSAYRPLINVDFLGINNGTDKAVHCQITNDGRLLVYGSADAGSVMRFSVTYFCG